MIQVLWRVDGICYGLWLCFVKGTIEFEAIKYEVWGKMERYLDSVIVDGGQSAV